MEIVALLTLCALAAWGWGTAIPALWSGEIETFRWIGRGSVTRDRAEQPIRYGCALLLHLYFGLLGVGGALALLPGVPLDQWILGAGLATGGGSLVLSWRLGRADLGSSARLARAALDALKDVPRPDQGYRAAGAIPPSALGPALTRFVRIELLKCDLAGVLAVSAIVLACVGFLYPISAWRSIGMLVSVLVGGFGVFRWKSLRRAIARSADEAVAALRNPLICSP